MCYKVNTAEEAVWFATICADAKSRCACGQAHPCSSTTNSQPCSPLGTHKLITKILCSPKIGIILTHSHQMAIVIFYLTI